MMLILIFLKLTSSSHLSIYNLITFLIGILPDLADNQYMISADCYETYYSLEYRRDIKINNILNAG